MSHMSSTGALDENERQQMYIMSHLLTVMKGDLFRMRRLGVTALNLRQGLWS